MVKNYSVLGISRT